MEEIVRFTGVLGCFGRAARSSATPRRFTARAERSPTFPRAPGDLRVNSRPRPVVGRRPRTPWCRGSRSTPSNTWLIRSPRRSGSPPPTHLPALPAPALRSRGDDPLPLDTAAETGRVPARPGPAGGVRGHGGLRRHRWGFVSAAHFSRAFRATYGVTPREWRAQAWRPAPEDRGSAYADPVRPGSAGRDPRSRRVRPRAGGRAGSADRPDRRTAGRRQAGTPWFSVARRCGIRRSAERRAGPGRPARWRPPRRASRAVR
ncbi:AraC family transcriptional regulator [Streptomyces sp. NPDC005576]|uniref:AraC family transcriptional regulator n=1 Tax=Streptomyces sp. NPDC005576 TaxID=3364726 RepID=UPI003685F509